MPELDGEVRVYEDAQEEDPQKEIMEDSLEVKQSLPSFYHCKAVDEEDPNYLLKALILRPEKPYIPTFLRVEVEQLPDESL